jgi:beta-phosphoglucomutase-like phosphatase (HAD superfamily)
MEHVRRFGLLRMVLWDYDGTLFPTDIIRAHAHVAAVQELGGTWDIDDARYMSFLGKPSDLVARLICGECGLGDVSVQKYRGAYQRNFMKRIGDYGLLPHPGTLGIMTRLHERNVAQAIVTSTTTEQCEGVLRRAGHKNFVQGLITADHIPSAKHKPHPEPYLRAIRELWPAWDGEDTDGIVAVEDSDSGCQSAKLAGIRIIIGIRHQLNGYQTLKDASIVMNVERYRRVGRFISKLDRLSTKFANSDKLISS